MTTTSFTRSVSFIFLVLTLTLSGCLDRKETITVNHDGSVKFQIKHSSDSEEELLEGDAPPQLDRGWFVQQFVEENEDGDKKYILEAEATYLPGEELPGDYASIRDPYADTHLQFPTTLEFEQRREGMYYHFHRTYKQRPWAFLERPKKLLEKSIKDLVDTKPRDMTIAQRQELLQMVARFETMKIETFARSAFDDIAVDAPQDLWLRMRSGIAGAVSAFDTLRLAEMLGAEEGEFDPEELVIEQKKIEDKAMEAMRMTLSDTTWFGAGATASFLDRYRRHKKYYEITEDLGDDVFEITIEMPGEIVGHNGDKALANRVTWKFTGEFLRDRDQELMVTSRVPN